MRHFLALPCPISFLAQRMPERSFCCALVTLSGTVQAVAAALKGAIIETENIAMITVAAKPHQAVTTGASILPVALFIQSNAAKRLDKGARLREA
jgi:hypothetical protein